MDLKRFGANPTTVPTFGTTTLSWSVTIPDSEFDIGIELNKQAVPVIGIKSLSLTQSTAFSLQAVTENAGRLLRRLTDPQKRTFVTTRLTLTPAGVTIIACPRQGTESSRRVARTTRARTTSGAARPKSRSRGSR